MRPAEIPDSAIIEAGQALTEAGRNVTGFALRQRVGGGNPGRLRQVWDEHLAGQQVAITEPVADLPVEVADELARETATLSERLAVLVRDLNDRAVRAADRRVYDVVRTAAEQREQAERELADAAATVEDLEDRLSETQAQVQTITDEREQARQASQAQAVTLAQVQERLTAAEASGRAAAEQHAAEIARVESTMEAERRRHREVQAQAQAEAERLRQALSEAQAAGAESGAALAVAREQVSTGAMEIERLQGRLSRAEHDGSEAERRAQEAEGRVDRAVSAQQVAERAAATATAARDEALAEKARAREEAARLGGRVEALEAQIAALLARLPAPAGTENPAGTSPAAAPAEAAVPKVDISRRQRTATAQPGLLPPDDLPPADAGPEAPGEA